MELFLDAARELMNDGATEFTVQEVVERSGQSLRTFYQYFAGKYELLLALFEESIEGAPRTWRRSSPSATTRSSGSTRFFVEYFRMCRPHAAGSPPRGPRPHWSSSPSSCSRRTRTRRRTRSRRSSSCSGRLLEEAEAAGALRPGLDRRRITGVVLQATMFNAFASMISAPRAGRRRCDEVLWDLLLRGIGTGTGA